MKESVRLLRFAVVGTLNYIITMLVIWIMMTALSFKGDYMVANITAYIIAQTHNFIWCRYWVFPSEEKKNNMGQQILLFCTAFGVAYCIQFLFLILLVEVLGTNEYVAQFLGLVLYGAINFIANKKITFR
ncbi:GtrA family protein [Phocaeicola sp.]